MATSLVNVWGDTSEVKHTKQQLEHLSAWHQILVTKICLLAAAFCWYQELSIAKRPVHTHICVLKAALSSDPPACAPGRLECRAWAAPLHSRGRATKGLRGCAA